jgi:predicted phage terminase large subunit-like protein
MRARLAFGRGAGHPDFFARHYLPEFTRLPFAPFHRMLFQWQLAMEAEDLAQRIGRRFAIAAPRGAAKSTIASLVLPLHDIAYRRERYIVLVSATERQAQGRLRAIAAALHATELAGHVTVEQSTQGVLAANGVRMEAYGAGQELRGLGWGPWRPTKVILDDAESSAAATSARRREALLDWFREVIEHLGAGYTHLLAVGTVLHEQGLLATLLRRPDFEGERLRSIVAFADPSPLWDEWRALLADQSQPRRRASAREFFEAHRDEMLRGAQVLWPEKEDYEQLLAQLAVQGRRAFFQEKQNAPLGPEDALFDPAAALRGTPGGGTLSIARAAEDGLRECRRAEFPRESHRFGYLDAAMGGSRRGDSAALARVARLPDGTLFAESLWVRRAPPREQVLRLFDEHAHHPFHRLAVEGTGFQELLMLPIEEERERRRRAGLPWDLPVEVVKPRQAKDARIAALEPLLASGALVLSPALPEEFWEQLANFPRVAHDDALDALAGAVELARGASGRKATLRRAEARRGGTGY